jgi:hypothetical protein
MRFAPQSGRVTSVSGTLRADGWDIAPLAAGQRRFIS